MSTKMQITISIDHDDQYERRSSMVEAITDALHNGDPYLTGRTVTFTYHANGFRATSYPIVLKSDAAWASERGE